MQPLLLNRFWHRRIYEVAFLLSIAMIALYAIPIFTNIAPNGLFGITVWVAIAATITAICSLILYFVPLKKPGYLFALLIYLLFTATSGLLVVQSGGIGSPFIAVWMLVSFFAGVFAVWGALPILLASAVFVAINYLTGNFSAGLVAMVAFSSIIPLVISLFIWRQQSDDQSTKDMKKMANELSEVANKSEVVINAIGDGVIAVDSQGIIQLINPAGQEMLGWGKQDALMLNYKSVIKMSDANNHELDPSKDPVQQVLNTNQEVRANDLTINTKTGKKITASIVVSPVGESGNGVIAVFRDVTKEKAEEREQAEFISTASHEMRTPVASIEGYLGLAMNPQTATIDQRGQEYIQKAHESAQHLGRLFQDLLDVSKSEDGRMTNVPKVTDMTAFAETVTQGLEAKAKEKNLQLIFKPTEQKGQKQIAPVYLVNQDVDHMHEVLDNLIENGIKYTPKGEVVVDVNGTDDKVTVSVKDTGLGIPAEDIPHLFQKFYRIDNVDRQEIGGTGLGLYLSRRLAEAMGGRLWVESIYKQGSTFFLELPRISSQEAETLKAQQAAAAAQPDQAANPFFPGAVQPTAAQPAAPTPSATPVPTEQPSPAPTVAPTETKAATSVPRGESLTREQIAEHVRKLQALARSDQPVPERPATSIPVTSPREETPPPTGQS